MKLKTSLTLITFTILLLLSIAVYAYDFYPGANINMREFYNFTNTNYFCNATSCLTLGQLASGSGGANDTDNVNRLLFNDTRRIANDTTFNTSINNLASWIDQAVLTTSDVLHGNVNLTGGEVRNTNQVEFQFGGCIKQNSTGSVIIETTCST